MRVARRGVGSEDVREDAFGGGEVTVGQRQLGERWWRSVPSERCRTTVTAPRQVAIWDGLVDQTNTAAQHHPSATI